MSVQRFWLWIDGVGGFLVCTGDTVVIGQPTSDDTVDVPILADLSRRQAVIQRQSESYLLEAVRAARVNGQLVAQRVSLGREAAIELGSAVGLRFRQPHPLSLSARLDVVSHHRTQPSSDGILLAHETLIVGPQLRSHVVCPLWRHELILFRTAGGSWGCRAADCRFEIDGQPLTQRGLLGERSRIVGPDFCVSLEPHSKIELPATKEPR